MLYYKVITTIKLPYDFLTYASSQPLIRGQVVLIAVRNKLQYGVIDSQETVISFDAEKIKSISEALPVALNERQMKFLHTFSFNTFNKLGISAGLFVQPFKLLTQKDIRSLTEIEKAKQNPGNNTGIETLNHQSQTNNQQKDQSNTNENKDSQKQIVSKPSNVEYIIENNLTIRIRYIIRSLIYSDSTTTSSKTSKPLDISSKKASQLDSQATIGLDLDIKKTNSDILSASDNYHDYPFSESSRPCHLFLFPENKLIKRVYQELITEDPRLKKHILIYTGTKDKSSKQAVKSLLLEFHQNNLDENDSKPSFQAPSTPLIIFGLRSALFLPFDGLDHIYCVDEGSPYYIQEQNSVYYDARESVYLLAHAFSADLTFLSTLPSIRLHRMYSEGISASSLNSSAAKHTNPLIVRLTNPQAKFPKNSLFSDDLIDFLESFGDDFESSSYFESEDAHS